VSFIRVERIGRGEYRNVQQLHEGKQSSGNQRSLANRPSEDNAAMVSHTSDDVCRRRVRPVVSLVVPQQG
jgi:hypothetical protein